MSQANRCNILRPVGRVMAHKPRRCWPIVLSNTGRSGAAMVMFAYGHCCSHWSTPHRRRVLMSAGMCLFAHIQCTYLTVSINTLIKLLIIIPVPVISAGFDVLVLREFI